MVDGTGAPWVEGDIAIAGDRIVAIGDLGKASARKRLDAKGLVVAPGFIDVQGQSEFNVLVDNRAASKITQGVTTEITGEGSSIAPVNDRMKKENASRRARRRRKPKRQENLLLARECGFDSRRPHQGSREIERVRPRPSGASPARSAAVVAQL